MSEAKPTPGPWVVEIDSDVDAEWAAQWPIIKTADGDTIICGTEGFYSTIEQDIANANLCADAGTVFHTTGLTPSQLVERVKELEEAAKLVLDWYEAENDHSKTDFYQRVQMCRDSEDAIRSALSKARPNTADGEAK